MGLYFGYFLKKIHWWQGSKDKIGEKARITTKFIMLQGFFFANVRNLVFFVWIWETLHPCLRSLSQKFTSKCLKIIINEHTISLIIREEQIAKPQFFIPVWLWHVFHDPLSMMPHTVWLWVHLQTILEEWQLFLAKLQQ